MYVCVRERRESLKREREGERKSDKERNCRTSKSFKRDKILRQSLLYSNIVVSELRILEPFVVVHAEL